MANISDCYVNLNGTTEDMLFAIAEMEGNINGEYLSVSKYMKNDSVDQRAGYSGAEVYDYKHDETSIQLALGGRWCAPHMYIEDFCKRHNLSGTYADAESGCNFYHVMKFENGVKTLDEQDEFLSQLAIDHGDIGYLVHNYRFVAEEEDWEYSNKEMIELFAKNGFTLDDLKKEWGL